MTLRMKVRIFSRYSLYLLWEFRWPLAVFWGVVLVGALAIYAGEGDHPHSYAEICHGVFLMVFFESALEFPEEWYLQPLFFLIPIIGLGAIADSLVRLAFLLFTKKQHLPEWQRIVASLYRNHVVVIGVGKVGLRIVHGLVNQREAVVVIEQRRDSPFVDEIHALRVPVIHGDGRQHKVLEQAGTPAARAIVLATDDDLANLDAALTAQDMNPRIRVVLRLFDETLAEKVRGAFRMPTVSIAHVSAPAFIAEATGRKVYHEFELGGRQLHLTDVTVSAAGALTGRTVGDVQAEREVNIVMYQGPQGVLVNPAHEVVLQSGATLLVMAPGDRLLDLELANRRRESHEEPVGD